MAKKDVNELIQSNRPTTGNVDITSTSFQATAFPDTALKVSFIDNDGKKIGGLTVQQALKISEADPSKKFYFENGDGYEEELTIEQVLKLTPSNYLPSVASEDSQNPIGPQVCGPPLVRFFGGGSGFGAAANVIISPISSSVIGFDIINPGFGYLSELNADLVDRCGAGSGANIKVNMEYDNVDTTGEGEGTIFPESLSELGLNNIIEVGINTQLSVGISGLGVTSIRVGEDFTFLNVGLGVTFIQIGSSVETNIEVGIGQNVNYFTSNKTVKTFSVGRGVNVITFRLGINDCVTPRKDFEKKLNKVLKRSKKVKNITILSPGDGYLPAPNGSLGGNERTWKDPDEGYVKTKCDGYYVVQPYKPILVEEGSVYYPPNGPGIAITEPTVVTLPLVPVTPPTTVSIIDILSPNLATLPISVTKEAISIDPTGNGIADAVGDIINYKITVTNITSQTLTNVVVNDPLTGLNETIDKIEAGISTTFTTTYVVTKDDIDSRKISIDNTVTANSDQQDEPSIFTLSVPLFASITPGPGIGTTAIFGPGIGTTAIFGPGIGTTAGPAIREPVSPLPQLPGGPIIPAPGGLQLPVPVYSVVLCIEEIVVLDPGFGYRPGDELIISPNNGTRTRLNINEFGNIIGVEILEGGCGYLDLPELRTNSSTGFNATFSTILKPTRVDPSRVPEEVPLISVVDCVGIIPPKTEFDIVLR